MAEFMRGLLNGLGSTFVDELSNAELVAMFKDTMRMLFAIIVNIPVFVSIGNAKQIKENENV